MRRWWKLNSDFLTSKVVHELCGTCLPHKVTCGFTEGFQVKMLLVNTLLERQEEVLSFDNCSSGEV